MVSPIFLRYYWFKIGLPLPEDFIQDGPQDLAKSRGICECMLQKNVMALNKDLIKQPNKCLLRELDHFKAIYQVNIICLFLPVKYN